MPVNLDFSQLDAALEGAFAETVDGFGEANRDAIQGLNFTHPRPTVRRGGGRVRVVISPRDKVDSGELLESQSEPIVRRSRSKTVAKIAWSANHSLLVHEGYATRTGTSVPAARWTRVAMKEYPLAKRYSEKLGARI